MALTKLGTILRINKTGASATELIIDRPLIEESKVIEGKNPEFLYFVAKAIAAGDEGPIDKNGQRDPNYNGNGDFFPKKEIEAAYQTFIGKGIYLDHNASSVMYSVGKIIDAFPTLDPENGEWSISCLAKIDQKLHPEIARKVATGELNTVSMGCSCGESKCSVCGTILRTDDDPKCAHLSPGKLMHDFEAEIDLPEYGIHKGQTVKSFAINSQINFNELSLVGIPAWSRAFVTTVLSNLKNGITKNASLTKEEQLDLVAQFEKLVNTLDSNTKEQVKAEFCGCPVTKRADEIEKCKCGHSQLTHSQNLNAGTYCKECDCDKFSPKKSKESSMSDTPQKQSNDEVTDLLKKVSAYEMEKLENYIQHKTRKAEATAAADTKTNDGNWMNSILEKAKNTAAGKVFARTIQRLAEEEKVEVTAKSKEELRKEWLDATKDMDTDEKYQKAWHLADKLDKMDGKDEFKSKTKKHKKSSLTATFSVNQAEPMKSSWALLDSNDKVILDASLHEIWGDQFEANKDFAISEEYGRAIAARFLDPKLGGVEKLADLWDVSYKLNKEANMEKQANPGDVKKPEGKFFVPGSDSTNKWNDKRVKIEYNISEPKPGENAKGPAAPKGQEVKTIYDISEPKPGESAKGPAAPKPAEVKTEYELGKPEGKKLNPANPEEKAHEKSEKGVKTGYKGDLMYDEEKKLDEKGGKKEAAKTVGDSPESSVKGDIYPKKNAKTSGDEPESSYNKTAKTVGDAPEGSVEESQYPKASEPNKDPGTSAKDMEFKHENNMTKTPDSSVAEKMPAPAKSDKDPETSVKDTKFEKHPDLTSKPETSSKEDQYPTPANPDKEPDSSVQKDSSKKVAGSICDKCSKPVEACGCMAALDGEHETENLSLEAPKPEMGSAFDKVEDKLTIGDGYDASKDKETKEIIISKDGKEMKRLPDGFGADVASVTNLLKAVLGLPATEEKKDEALSPVDEVVEKVEVHPEQVSPSETPSLKASALEAELNKKAEELKAKEDELNKKAEEIKKFELEKQAERFQNAVASRTTRCRRVIEAMLEKNVLSMNDEVLKSKLQEGTYLLDARKAALDYSISAKLKELMASNDVELAAIEKTVDGIAIPKDESMSKKATKVPFVAWDAIPSQDDEIAAIFNQMGKKNHWQ